MARTKVSSSRTQAPRPADNVLSPLNRIRVFEERETHFKHALQAAMDQAETMETSLGARIAQLEDKLDTLNDTTDKLYAKEAELSELIKELRKDNARLQNEVVRLSSLNRAPESEDSDYEPEYEEESESEEEEWPREPEPESESEPEEPEEEPVRRSLADVYTQLEESGCRAHTLAHILRTTMRFPNDDINAAYNRVLNTNRFYVTLQKDDIRPNFWKVLGHNEDEKLYNAKKVVELLYRRPY